MNRHTRYQGAIVKDDHLLLIRHREHETRRSYWLLPGGGIEPGESEFDCVHREMQEETGLEVHVVRLIVDEPGIPGGVYQRRKTYLCHVITGEASPGYEPEESASRLYGIVEVRWFDMREEEEWLPEVTQDPVTYPQVLNIQSRLGYNPGHDE